MSANSNTKDTIYIDVDDEITTIIDKLRSSPHKIVALVLPKRASVFQSIVNMKLLKRSAEAAKKNVVLVTSEAALMPLAGAVGLHVAKTPQSKPEIPAAATPISDDDVIDASDDEEGFTADNAGSAPIGDLAAVSGTAAVASATNDIETLALDDDEDDAAADGAAGAASAGAGAGAAAKMSKFKKDKKLKVPNFNRFRVLIAAGVAALILLLVGLYFALNVLPKATITIDTDASDVNSSLTPTLDTAARKLDKATLTVPAKIAQQQKTQSQQVAATGSKNNGEKASGNITVTVKRCAPNIAQPDDVGAGTGVSSGSTTFITQSTMSFAYNGASGGSCVNYKSNSVSIIAQAPGTKYNLNGATFSIAGHSDMSGTGSTSGGTDEVVKVIQQSDIDSAKEKIGTSSETASIKTALKQQLQGDGQYALPDTFDAGEPAVTSSGNVGDVADNVTVTAIYTYTMYGTEKDNLDTLLNDDIKGQVDTSKETILTNGLEKAQVRVIASTPTTKKINLQTTGTVGPEIHTEDIKKASAGKKSGDVIPTIKNLPGVTDVQIHLSPFWVSSIPKHTDKITIVVDKASSKK